jgi:hypothetical protein
VYVGVVGFSWLVMWFSAVGLGLELIELDIEVDKDVLILKLDDGEVDGEFDSDVEGEVDRDKLELGEVEGEVEIEDTATLVTFQ